MERPPNRPLTRKRRAAADLGASWKEHAEPWVVWARKPGHDSYWRFHRDLFLASVPAAGRKTPLEELEDIEILRFLELGFPVQMVRLESASIAVDVPEDVARVEAALREVDA